MGKQSMTPKQITLFRVLAEWDELPLNRHEIMRELPADAREDYADVDAISSYLTAQRGKGMIENGPEEVVNGKNTFTWRLTDAGKQAITAARNTGCAEKRDASLAESPLTEPREAEPVKLPISPPPGQLDDDFDLEHIDLDDSLGPDALSKEEFQAYAAVEHLGARATLQLIHVCIGHIADLDYLAARELALATIASHPETFAALHRATQAAELYGQAAEAKALEALAMHLSDVTI